MGWKRIKEAVALLLIGDGIISLLEPRRHTKLWLSGPRTYRKLMNPLDRKPALAQMLGLGLIGIGFWLASRQKA